MSFYKNTVIFGTFHDLSTHGQRYFASPLRFIYFVRIKLHWQGRINVGYVIQAIKIVWGYFDPRGFCDGRFGIYEKKQGFFGANTEYELLFGGFDNANVMVKDLTGLHCLKYNLP